MGMATCRVVNETGTPDRTNGREIWGGYREKFDWSVRVLSTKLAVGVIFFASIHFAIGRLLVAEVMERRFRSNRRCKDRRVGLG